MNADEQEPDMRLGDYFVDAKDGELTFLISGPYRYHADALADLNKCRELATQSDPRAAFYSFGTCRYQANSGKVGLLQKHGLHPAPMDNKHIVDPDVAKRLLELFRKDGAVWIWHAPGYPQGSDDGPVWYTPIFASIPDPRADAKPTTALMIGDFDVAEYGEVFRRQLPDDMRPGIKTSDARRAKIMAEFEQHHDAAASYNEEGSRFAIEPNKEKPWLYDGVVYAIKRRIPLKDWKGEF